jgi:hypothetical protein
VDSFLADWGLEVRTTVQQKEGAEAFKAEAVHRPVLIPNTA